MNYAKGVISGVAGVILMLMISLLRDIGTEKATGIAAVSWAVAEAFFSPLFWFGALLLSALFWASSQLNRKPLRVAFFWIPTIGITTLGCAIFALFMYAFVHFRRI